MKVNYWFISTIVLCFVIVLLLSLPTCNGGKTSPIKTSVKTEIRYKTDTIFSEIMRTKLLESRVKHDTFLFYRIVSSNSDTILKFIEACTDSVFVSDTIVKKNSFIAIIADTLQQNKIIGRSFHFADLRPDTFRIVTNTVEAKQPLVKIYVGVDFKTGVKATGNSFQGGADIDAIFKDRFLLGLNGGISSKLEPLIGVRFSTKISLRKHE